jgi:hypothetical protein
MMPIAEVAELADKGINAAGTRHIMPSFPQDCASLRYLS